MGPPDTRDRSRDARALHALVFAGGDAPDPGDLPASAVDALVIAADSGLDHARALGVAVDLVVGDLDSVDPAALDAAVAAGTTVEQHPVAKDATDLELALDAALDRGATSVHVIGIGGGRFDHLLGNVLLLGSSRYEAARVDARIGDSRITVVHDRATLDGAPGGLCSLLPLGGPALGVRTDGLRFPLRRETLPAGTTRGVSNEFLGARAEVSLEDGVLLAVVPVPVPAVVPPLFRKDD
jgi:thiamine pyrophosphokinase